MTGSFNHQQPHYRRSTPREYARAKQTGHSPTVYLRETPWCPRWTAGWPGFAPELLDRTCEVLAAASQPDPTDTATQAAAATIRECDQHLRQHRAALEAGADPVVVSAWINQPRARRARAQATLQTAGTPNVLTKQDIRVLLADLPDHVAVLASAAPSDKTRLYAELGLRLTYHPAQRRVRVQAAPVQPSDGATGVHRLCRRQDLNLHGLAATRPST